MTAPTPRPRIRATRRVRWRVVSAVVITMIGAGLVAWGVVLSPLPWLAPIVVGAPLFAFGLIGIQVDDRRRR